MKKNQLKDGTTIVKDYTGTVKYGTVKTVDRKMSTHDKAMDAMKQKPKMRGHE